MAPGQGPPDEINDDVAYFQSIPWCARHLASQPDLLVTRAFTRVRKPGVEDALMCNIFNTRDTVRAFVLFFPAGDFRDSYRDMFPPAPTTTTGTAAAAGGAPAAKARAPAPPDTRLLPEVNALVSLGPLVSGWNGVAHGGMVALLFDETLSLVHPGARWLRDGSPSEGPVGIVTAYLNTTYLRPVSTPGEYLIRVRLKKAEGRKILVEAEMEDEKGEKLARAEALFIEMKAKL